MHTPVFAELLERGAGGVLALGALWLLAIVGASAVEVLSGGRCRALRAVGCPAPWRPVLLALLGVLLASPAAVARDAGEEPSRWLPLPVRPVGAGPDVPAPEPTAPDRTAPEPTTPGPTASAPRPAAVTRVVVRPGDTLWQLAARDQPDAGPGALAARVVAVHDLNRGVIGPDPDLIHPGQRLRLPPTPPGDLP